MDSTAATPSNYLHNGNSGNSGMGSTASEVTLIDSLASSDDIQEIDLELQERPILPQHRSQLAASPPSVTEPCVVYLRLDDNIIQKHRSRISRDSPLIHEMFRGTLPVLNNDGHGGELEHAYEHLLHDSIEEVSSLASIEEKEPLNETFATAKALTLRRLSATLLDSYRHLKHTVRQRTCRLYYVKWTQFHMRRYLLSASTQTSMEDASQNVGLVESSLESNVPTTQGGAFFTSPHLRTFPSCNAHERSTYPTKGNSPFYQNGRYEPPQPLLPTPTESTCMYINNTNKNNYNSDNISMDEISPIEQTDASLCSSLRPRSKPCILLDYGQQSFPPNRGVAQSHYVPSTKLPKLITLVESLAVLSSSSVSVGSAFFVDGK